LTRPPPATVLGNTHTHPLSLITKHHPSTTLLLSAAAGGLGVLTLHAQAPVVTQTAMVAVGGWDWDGWRRVPLSATCPTSLLPPLRPPARPRTPPAAATCRPSAASASAPQLAGRLAPKPLCHLQPLTPPPTPPNPPSPPPPRPPPTHRIFLRRSRSSRSFVSRLLDVIWVKRPSLEPVGDLVLARVGDDRHHLLQLLGGDLAGPAGALRARFRCLGWC